MKKIFLFILLFLYNSTISEVSSGKNKILADEAVRGNSYLKLENNSITCKVDRKNGNLRGLLSSGKEHSREWLPDPWNISLQHVVSKKKIALGCDEVLAVGNTIQTKYSNANLGYSGSEIWSRTEEGLSYKLTLKSEGKRSEHKCSISMPVHGKGCYGFASNRMGIVKLNELPLSVHYGNRDAIMPLMSLFDITSDQAITVAVAADCFLPNIQMKLTEENLEFHFSHFGLGDSKQLAIHLVFYSHPADYRAALRAYSFDFPQWFKSPIPRVAEREGGFWYHHIMETPDEKELQRQDIRAIWSSFFFEVIGQFVPMRNEGDEWFPYTYEKTWSRQKYAGTAPIKEKMSYSKIEAFTNKLLNKGIGHYVYFNFNEYGGISHKPKRYEQRLKKVFNSSIQRNTDGTIKESWEEAVTMNPDPDRPFGQHLEDCYQCSASNDPWPYIIISLQLGNALFGNDPFHLRFLCGSGLP